jgi:competence protein ComEC
MLFKKLSLLIAVLAALNLAAWSFIELGPEPAGAEIYFLNVGQGDGELIKFGRANFLIDSGKDRSVVGNLEKLIPFYKKRIDVAFVSHGQTDHAGGMFYLLENFEVGAVIYNGDSTPLWQNLKMVLEEKKIPWVILKAGDAVSYKENRFQVLWPESLSEKIGFNDNSMVIKYENGDFSSLFTADISSKVEAELLNEEADIKSDILKVPHHGSKYSSSQKFLETVNPGAAVIEVGKNSYGHPTKEVLARIAEAGAKILRTDLDGIVKFDFFGGKIRISRLR